MDGLSTTHFIKFGSDFGFVVLGFPYLGPALGGIPISSMPNWWESPGSAAFQRLRRSSKSHGCFIRARPPKQRARCGRGRPPHPLYQVPTFHSYLLVLLSFLQHSNSSSCKFGTGVKPYSIDCVQGVPPQRRPRRAHPLLQGSLWKSSKSSSLISSTTYPVSAHDL